MDIFLLLIIFLLSIGLAFFLYKYLSIRKKYSSIIDIEKELLRINEKVLERTNDLSLFETDFTERKNKLTQEYNNAYQIFSKLKNEISVLEENYEIIDFGLYKPHFNFDASDKYKIALDKLYEKQKSLIRLEQAVVCDTEWTVGGSKTEGKKMIKHTIKLMLRAFNGECDSAIAKVKWNNAQKMEERIKKSFEAINKTGEINQVYITNDYLLSKLDELHLTYEYNEKLHEEKEEQRKIQEEIREEEKVQREIEKAKVEAEKEEIRYQKALEKAREEIQRAKGEKLDELNLKILELEKSLNEAKEQKERAISRAQLTKSGHVYIISNIGSFGENIFKIGMTRRFDPKERIDELSNASVPFQFDIHAMMSSDDAPNLERKLHTFFSNKRINLVNHRKEFFEVSLDEIEVWAMENNIDTKITKLAEAREYRETQAMKAGGKKAVDAVVNRDIPFSIDDLFSEN